MYAISCERNQKHTEGPGKKKRKEKSLPRQERQGAGLGASVPSLTAAESFPCSVAGLRRCPSRYHPRRAGLRPHAAGDRGLEWERPSAPRTRDKSPRHPMWIMCTPRGDRPRSYDHGGPLPGKSYAATGRAARKLWRREKEKKQTHAARPARATKKKRPKKKKKHKAGTLPTGFEPATPRFEV